MDQAEAIHTLIEERELLMRGIGHNWLTMTSWTAADAESPRAVIELRGRLLGVPITAKVTLNRLTRADFDRIWAELAPPGGAMPHVWEWLMPLRLALVAATVRCEAMTALASRWVVVHALAPLVGPGTVDEVLRSMRLPQRPAASWAPIVRDLAPDTAAFWRSIEMSEAWLPRIIRLLDACAEIVVSGPLAELAAKKTGLIPPQRSPA